MLLTSMIHFAQKKLLQRRPITSPLSHGYLFSTSTIRHISEISNPTDPQSLTVCYLSNSCGLSIESAITASKKLHIEPTNKPDAVLNLLRTHGLTQTHIRDLIANRPVILLADIEETLKPNLELFGSLGFSGTNLAKILNKDPRILESDARSVLELFRAYGFSEEQAASLAMKRPSLYTSNAHKNFKPKLEFFESLGFSGHEIAKMLSINSSILARSLENGIIPCIRVLKRFVGTDENVLKALKKCYRLLNKDPEKELEPNISMLISHGVPESLILKLFLIHPEPLLLTTSRFSEIVSEVTKLGFDPKTLVFILAISSMGVMSKTRWEQKLEAYRSVGLSEDEIFAAFKLQPMIMTNSEEKIRELVGFFMNKLNLEPSMISKDPNILLLSLKKRIIPRCSVMQLLMSKDLIKREISLAFMFRMAEKKFVERFVIKYQHVIPEVLEAHQGKIAFEDFPLIRKYE